MTPPAGLQGEQMRARIEQAAAGAAGASAPARRIATAGDIRQYQFNLNGTLRTRTRTGQEMRADGLSVDDQKIAAERKIALSRGAKPEPHIPGALIDRYLLRPDGTRRSAEEVAEAMSADRLYPQEHRIRARLALIDGGGRPAGDGDIDRYLRNTGGSLRTVAQTGRAMRADGFNVGNDAIMARLNNAGGGRKKTRDEDIDGYLRNSDGSLNPALETIARMRNDGFAFRNDRVYARRRQLTQEDAERAAGGG